MELHNHISDNYGVSLKFKQSYYDLFDEAGISCQKTQKKNQVIWTKLSALLHSEGKKALNAVSLT